MDQDQFNVNRFDKNKKQAEKRKKCNITQSKTSGFGTSKTLGPYSNCLFFCKFSLKSASVISKRSPCTNVPMICNVIIYF